MADDEGSTFEARRRHYLKLADDAERQADRHTGYVRDSYLRLAAAPFTGGLGLRRHYAHASVSRGTASGVWTTALRAVVGLDDGGTALTPGVVWAPRGNLTVNLDGVVLLGPDDSEYRLSPFRGALQARMKVLW